MFRREKMAVAETINLIAGEETRMQVSVRVTLEHLDTLASSTCDLTTRVS